jgi:hypothetical protein
MGVFARSYTETSTGCDSFCGECYAEVKNAKNAAS